ncbi:hypothetical protein HMPREF1586_01408, partial [Gardnerella vaginalis JCP8522]
LGLAAETAWFASTGIQALQQALKVWMAQALVRAEKTCDLRQMTRVAQGALMRSAAATTTQ